MKKLIIAMLLSLGLFSSVMAFDYPANWDATAPCGWSFAKSAEFNVPFTYCWAKQDRGDVTFNNLINVACSGSTCLTGNHS